MALPSAALLRALPPPTKFDALSSLAAHPAYATDASCVDVACPPHGWVWIPPSPAVPANAVASTAPTSGVRASTTTKAPTTYGGFSGVPKAAASSVASSALPSAARPKFSTGAVARVAASTTEAVTAAATASSSPAAVNVFKKPGAVSPAAASGGTAAVFKRPGAAAAQEAPLPPPPPPPPPKAELPEGWISANDDNGDEYFFNTITGESSWDVPSA